jgi:CBS domain-containing protein
MMRIKHVMTRDPSFALPSDSAQRAACIMRDERAGIVPIVESEQSRRVVGVVTDRDLCMNVVAEGRDPGAVSIEQCMTTAVVTCTPQDSADRLMELMRESQIRRVPVVDADGTLQGIVSLADLVERADLRTTQTHETLRKVSAPTAEPSKPRARSRKAA